MIEEENEVITNRKNEIREQNDMSKIDFDRHSEILLERIRELSEKALNKMT
jgi:hypothetical protein